MHGCRTLDHAAGTNQLALSSAAHALITPHNSQALRREEYLVNYSVVDQRVGEAHPWASAGHVENKQR